ncbi:MAG: sulfurtransferase complex subunit TusB [Shewanella sp.]|nr:sulfurtransferase complex subunit TusB [Shewanella sp.]MCF1430086.1 sulfurtransferase complex subunit TusB [Shewanella sp.]MCF1438300.1 sulfurtransferase complex subunit TusB [Shewanella sp.]MCF1456379.1 sulfurtransferase complex subunit TusB [Shewanella sp.]
MILHHIQTSPGNDNALATSLKYAVKNDSFVLTGNGVVTVLKRQWLMALSPFKVYLLADDINARGLQPHTVGYPLIAYQDFVALTLSHDKVITW